jgi:ferredoxin
MERWNPSVALTKREQFLMKRLTRTKKLFAFLRMHRHELFDDPFQAELESMYRDSGAGLAPLPPALLAMALILQAYTGASDAEAVELTIVDLRWQMVLGCLNADEPAFSQGTLQAFRDRVIRSQMDVRLLERTIELARSTGAFDPKKLPRTLRVAIDSAPLEGAGRVEDTLNLIAHAARKVIECIAGLVNRPIESICAEAGITLLLESSVKKALDVEWSDPKQKTAAMKRLFEQAASLQDWIERRLADEIARPPLKEHVDTLKQLIAQDLEPDPSGGMRIREGVAVDRRVSVEDGEMRHGRKSKSKRFNGYKRHIAADVDTTLILACAVTPANRPEDEAIPGLRADIQRQDREIDQLLIDRGYINSAVVDDVLRAGGDVICKPWVPRASVNGTFTKSAFKINVRGMTITCPAGETERFVPGEVVEFDPDACSHCKLRSQCTMAAEGAGRTVSMADNELLQGVCISS